MEIELAILTFGKYAQEFIYQNYQSLVTYKPINLEATEEKAYVVDVLKYAIETTEKQYKSQNKNHGDYIPWIVLVTTGEFHDTDIALYSIRDNIRHQIQQNKLRFLIHRVDKCDIAILEKLSYDSVSNFAKERSFIDTFHIWIDDAYTIYNPDDSLYDKLLPPLVFTI